jgi:hypothetical protein
MTFKNLLLLQLSKLQTSDNKLDILREKSFWYWDKVEHKQEHLRTNGYCCFNHICGSPLKDGKEYRFSIMRN